MKKNIISVALLAVLTTMAVSCQKENLLEVHASAEEIGTIRQVYYTVDGVDHQVTLYTDAEWEAFVESLVAMSGQGHEVCLTNQSSHARMAATKDVQTFTTRDASEAKAWAQKKADEGYTVVMEYNDGLYTCIASRR